MSEFQKPFDRAGYLNAELITRQNFHQDKDKHERCDCRFCTGRRRAIKREVNELRGFKFYKDV